MADELRLNRSDIQELARSLAGAITQGNGQIARQAGNGQTGGKRGGDGSDSADDLIRKNEKLRREAREQRERASRENAAIKGYLNTVNGPPTRKQAWELKNTQFLKQAADDVLGTMPSSAGIRFKQAGASLLAGLPSAIVGGAANMAFDAAMTITGISKLGDAFNNYFNPEVYSAPVSGGDLGINDYLNGLYATAMTVNCPSKEDVIKIDNWLTWNGCPTERMGVPMIYTSGKMKVNGKVINIAVKNRYGFMFIKTSGGVVRCPNAQAKAQFEAMLNNGTRFWSVDADRQETAA